MVKAVATPQFDLEAMHAHAGDAAQLLKALGEAGCTTGRKPKLTPLGNEVMWRRAQVKLAMPPFAMTPGKVRPPTGAAKAEGGAEVAVDEGLLRSLKERRMAVAKERGVAAFIVASNALLERIATLPGGATRDE